MSTTPPRRRTLFTLLLPLLAVLGVVGALDGTASAGGWAVTTLDALPTAEPGEPTDVGFTIRQHGVTPVDVDGVAIEVIGATGERSSFPARRDGADGHYVATVTFPDAGTFTWAVEQGWFGRQELGSISIDAPAAGGASEYRYPPVVRWGLPAVALVFGALAVADLVLAVRRRRAVPA